MSLSDKDYLLTVLEEVNTFPRTYVRSPVGWFETKFRHHKLQNGYDERESAEAALRDLRAYHKQQQDLAEGKKKRGKGRNAGTATGTGGTVTRGGEPSHWERGQKSRRVNIDWALEHLKTTGVRPEDAPSRAAWVLLQMAMDDEGHKRDLLVSYVGRGGGSADNESDRRRRFAEEIGDIESDVLMSADLEKALDDSVAVGVGEDDE
jgi:hypothetical protein